VVCRADRVLIGGGINVDGEDIAADDQGHVIVAEFGNNAQERHERVPYFIPEPRPRRAAVRFCGRCISITRRSSPRFPRRRTISIAMRSRWLPNEAAQVGAVCFNGEGNILLACETTATIY